MSTFARPPVEGRREELRVWAHGYDSGYVLAVGLGRDYLAALRAEVAGLRAEIARRDAEDHADAESYAAHVRTITRGDTRSHLQVLHERAERSGDPDLYAAQIATAERHRDRIRSTPTTTPRKAAA